MIRRTSIFISAGVPSWPAVARLGAVVGALAIAGGCGNGSERPDVVGPGMPDLRLRMRCPTRSSLRLAPGVPVSSVRARLRGHAA